MFDIQSFKVSLLDDVARLTLARAEYKAAVDTLSYLGSRISYSSLDCLPRSLESLLRNRFNQVEKKLTAQYANEYPVEVTTKEEFYTFEYSRYKSEQTDSYLNHDHYFEILRFGEQTSSPQKITQRLEQFIHGMPWEDIKADFDSQCINIKDAGMKQAVACAHKFLRLGGYGEPKVTNKGLMTEAYYPSCSIRARETSDDVIKFMEALSPIANEAAVETGDALPQLAEALREVGVFERVPVRTRFGKGKAIDLTVFTDKIKIIVSHDVLEAIQAATMLYGTEKQVDDIMRCYDKKNAA
ncbi:hypothetical protein ACT3UJ_06710 [Halomonas sp. 86]|uniref:hypothetical protein n=1 Tax=unclassified Halomonas TaxID=2609666 RepID=UPI004033E2E5